MLMPIYANYSIFFEATVRKLIFTHDLKIFENSIIPCYKLNINIGLIFYRGSAFCIDFSVHLLLI